MATASLADDIEKKLSSKRDALQALDLQALDRAKPADSLFWLKWMRPWPRIVRRDFVNYL